LLELERLELVLIELLLCEELLVLIELRLELLLE
jgi:hypothetical protein